MMASSKKKGLKSSGPKDSNLDTNDEDKTELCPGFRDVDAFVKVSKQIRSSC